MPKFYQQSQSKKPADFVKSAGKKKGIDDVTLIDAVPIGILT